MIRHVKIICLFAAITLCSCNGTQPEYSKTAIFFVFDNSTHQDATLMTAMNIVPPGTFCAIRRGTGADTNYLYLTNNQGQSSKQVLNAVDLKRTIILGLNNGIVVGYGNMSMPTTFYAYDTQCPNCFIYGNIPVRSYPLGVGEDGMATCPNCHRMYNMNTGGNIVDGDPGNKLTRYRASTTGPFGVLAVN